MPSRELQRPGAPGICGNTVATVNAVCVLGACFRNPSPISEKLNAIFFAATILRCRHSGERTRGIPRNGRSPLAIDLRTTVPRHNTSIFFAGFSAICLMCRQCGSDFALEVED